MGYIPPDDSYTKTFIELFVFVAVKDSVGGCLYELNQFPLLKMQSLFIQ